MTEKRDPPIAAYDAERSTRRGLGIPDTSIASATAHVFDSRPLSRGPEYHPPSLPVAARDRIAVKGTGSGTFRVGTPVSAQVRPTGPATEPPERPSSPTLPPLERATPRLSAPPQQPKLDNKHLLWAAALGLALGSGVALTVIRVPARAWGVVKAAGAPEALHASVAGSVSKVLVAAGAEVQEGDPVIELASPELQSKLQGRRAQLESLRRELESAAREEKALLAGNLAALERRRSLLAQRLQLKDAELMQRKARLEEVTALVNASSVPEAELIEANATLQAAQEARLGILDALSQLDLEVADRRSGLAARERSRRSRLADAEVEVQQAENALAVTTVTAPAPGWIESLWVTPASSVQPGTELARFIPRLAPRSVLALVPVQDAVDLAVGAQASVEILPSREAGPLPARIQHVSREVAPAARTEAILGRASRSGFVQVELELLDSPAYHSLEPGLRTGSRAIVHFATSRRRLAGMLSDAVSEWWTFQFWG